MKLVVEIKEENDITRAIGLAQVIAFIKLSLMNDLKLQENQINVREAKI
jgi:hypothetical protein